MKDAVTAARKAFMYDGLDEKLTYSTCQENMYNNTKHALRIMYDILPGVSCFTGITNPFLRFILK